ncbi:efflux RND transporter periplasmic adaptor subunit [Gimesia aquarii]|uniref:Macrolide export protein MacA n=1 Tax=Gimesia aquarii TaxID=2527964 RepID=A0A517VZN2_9PLAN|nr:efflux RND transporter periplasmic adaptor subunit [Gimesia aquarii]QDT98440.1 Macrolide export protein MacA [Gimesia aquarii]
MSAIANEKTGRQTTSLPSLQTRQGRNHPPHTQQLSAGKPVYKQLYRGILSILLLGGGMAGYGLLSRSTTHPQKKSPEPFIPRIDIATVKPFEKYISIVSDGEVVPLREVKVGAEVQGRITFKSPNSRIGCYIKKGDVLVQIDPRDFEFEVKRLQSELTEAQANLDEVKTDRVNTTDQIEIAKQELAIRNRELKRYEKIATRGAFSQADLDATRLNELNARNNLQKLEGQIRISHAKIKGRESFLKRIQTQLSQARLDLERTKIIAPISGLITQVNVEQGSFIQKGAEVITIQDTTTFEVDLSLPITKMQWIWESSGSEIQANFKQYELPELPAIIRFNSNEIDYKWQGILHRYASSGVDETTRTVPLRIRVLRPMRSTLTSTQPELMDGMFVNVEIQAKINRELLQVPASAIQPGDSIWSVSDGQIRHNEIDVLSLNSETAVINVGKSSLQVGDLVVISPVVDAREGMRVKVIK